MGEGRVVDQPVVETQKSNEQEAQPEKPLLQRVAEFKEDESVERNESPAKETFTTFDVKKISAVEDPVQRANLMAAYHQMQADYTRKMQEVAPLRKQAQQNEPLNWSPERVQKLLNDPSFVQAAQAVAQLEEAEQFSNLSVEEKAEIRSLKEQNQKVMRQMNQLEKQKQDEYLRNKYPDYAPDMVDTTISKLVNGEMDATREDIYKVLNFESSVERAYRLGLKDGQGNRSERIQATSIDGKYVTNGDEDLELDSKKSFNSNWDSIKAKTLRMMQSGTMKK